MLIIIDTILYAFCLYTPVDINVKYLSEVMPMLNTGFITTIHAVIASIAASLLP